jgi:hypothetical protein
VGGDCLQGDARLTSSFREVEHGGDGGGGGGGRGFRGLLLEENGANGFACKHVLQKREQTKRWGGGVGSASTCMTFFSKPLAMTTLLTPPSMAVSAAETWRWVVTVKVVAVVVVMMMRTCHNRLTFASMPPLPLSLLEPVEAATITSPRQITNYDNIDNDGDSNCDIAVAVTARSTVTPSRTCHKARVVVEHVDLPSARAAAATSEWPSGVERALGVLPARRLVEHAVDVGKQQAHVSAHLHRHQRREAVVIAERVSKYLQGRGEASRGCGLEIRG